MSYEIRSAHPEDAAVIEEVRLATWRVAYRDVMPADHLASLEVRPEVVRNRAEVLRSGRVSGLVAEVRGEVRGFALYGPSRDEDVPGMEVYAIYVLPDEFSTGMGRALMTAAVEDLAASGHGEAGLWVLAANARARRFYERFGFTPSGRAKMLPDPPLEEVHYRLALTAP
ncbi:GNAT family N-acetyltransferase [Actinomadura sp. ATCC 31491]|uniref:GNAT family N-acetyltransferase n=1 Tax=Actinomadura luzonensis TaxID=2805427 RepID=A0ABT0FZ38_9ACTN|nr:GNAT family N-acetyltransferase [Actinomadura luzonensis]MCK2217614.1 GNAT family N-acetyltransferase [Actinomadura luzonensis]